MWFLVTHSGRRIALPSLPADIGSAPSAHVHLSDPSVAPLHARLLPGAATGLRLEVCDGALVELDGWALTEADLRAGDELLVGTVTLRLEREHEAPGVGEPPLVTRRPLDPPSSGPLSAPPYHSTSGPAPSRGRSASAASARSAFRGGTLPGTGARRGLLHADLSQLSFVTRCILGLGLALVAAAIVWVTQALVLGWA